MARAAYASAPQTYEATDVQTKSPQQYMGVEPKIGVENPPNHPILIGLDPLFSPSILGYHYFWKHPYSSYMLLILLFLAAKRISYLSVD